MLVFTNEIKDNFIGHMGQTTFLTKILNEHKLKDVSDIQVLLESLKNIALENKHLIDIQDTEIMFDRCINLTTEVINELEESKKYPEIPKFFEDAKRFFIHLIGDKNKSLELTTNEVFEQAKNSFISSISNINKFWESSLEIILKELMEKLRVLKYRKSALARDMYMFNDENTELITKTLKTRADERMKLNSRYERKDYLEFSLFNISEVAGYALNLVSLLEVIVLLIHDCSPKNEDKHVRI